MKILKLEPGKAPAEMELEDDLTAMQNLVGGNIEAVYPFAEPVVLICNEEGKLLRLPYNRALRNEETGDVYDVICGSCFLCGAPPDSDHFESLTAEQIAHFKNYYNIPELFLQTASGILIMKLN